MGCNAQHIKLDKVERSRDLWNDGVWVPKSLLHVMEPYFPDNGWTSASQMKAMNEFLVLLHLRAWLLLYLSNCLYLKPWVFSLLLFRFSPPSHPGQVGEWLCGAELLPGVKPLHIDSSGNHSVNPDLSCMTENEYEL